MQSRNAGEGLTRNACLLPAIDLPPGDPAACEDRVVRRVKRAVPAAGAAFHDEIAEAFESETAVDRHAVDLGAARALDLVQAGAAIADDQLGRALGAEVVGEEIVQVS